MAKTETAATAKGSEPSTATTAAKPGRKKRNIQDTAEFKAALAQAVQDAVPAIVAQIAQARGGGAEAPGDMSFAQGLAMAIANLNDQGTGRKRVAPEVLEARLAARALMQDLLVEAHAKGAVPSYTLRSKVYLGEVLVDPFWIASDHTQKPTVIDWPQVPNEAMIPHNEVARSIHEQFMLSIGSTTKVAAERPLKMTAGGLVVHGRPHPMRANQQQDTANSAADSGLNIHHRGKPGQFKETHVLGTVAPPARATA